MRKDNGIVEIITENESTKKVILEKVMQVIRVNVLDQMLCIQVSKDSKVYTEIMTGLIESDGFSSVTFQMLEDFEEVNEKDNLSKSEEIQEDEKAEKQEEMEKTAIKDKPPKIQQNLSKQKALEVFTEVAPKVISEMEKNYSGVLQEITEEDLEKTAKEVEEVQKQKVKVEKPKVVKKEEISNFTAEQLEEKKEAIKKIFTEKGWRMSLKEVSQRMKIPDKLTKEILTKLCEEGIIEVRDKNYEKKKESHDNYLIAKIKPENQKAVKTIFDEEKYSEIFDYLMKSINIDKRRLNAMFPENATEVFNYLLEHYYIREIPDAGISESSYTILLRIRAYYAIKKNPGVGENELKSKLVKIIKNLSKQELQNALNVAQRKEEIVKMNRGYYINPQHEM